jgi:uncharacterized protein YdeI (BOF family)
MKKIILALTVATFSIGAFAGDSCCNKEKATTASKDKAPALCPAAKETASTTAAKKDANKKLVESPRGSQAKKS